MAGRKIENVLSLCCGFGTVETAFVLRLTGVRHCLGLDLAEQALQVARKRAEQLGLGHIITYQTADLNHYQWPIEEYDLVIANGALHHLSGLRSVLAGIHRSLKKGGALYANEHVGAKWQDHSGRQLELINAFAYLVPKDLRRMRRAGPLGYFLDALRGELRLPSVKPHWPASVRLAHKLLSWLKNVSFRPGSARIQMPMLWKGNKAWLLKTDPSEGVASEEVIQTIREHFSDVNIRQYGGPLLAYALDENFYKNYDPHDQSHQKLLDVLIGLEETFIAIHQVPIEHAIILARKDLVEKG